MIKRNVIKGEASMIHDKRKVALIGTGMVGMSYAYAMLNQNAADELALIDINQARAKGEAMDLNHGLAFAESSMKIYAGGYEDCADADIAVLCAGVAQKAGESRTDLLRRNARVFQSIVGPALESGFRGIFLVATNPVDIMTRIVRDISGFADYRVLGSGTSLDTARLRYLLGEHVGVNPKNVHAYVMGEHGDSEFVPWSQAMIAAKRVGDLCAASVLSMDELRKISGQVKDSAQVIINAKQATYYGIGMALTRITRAIFANENSILTVSAPLNGEYGERDVYAGAPCIINRMGIKQIISLPLDKDEAALMNESCALLRKFYDEL